MTPPNILMIMTDQQRRDTLGVYGCDWIPTPHLDRLGEAGAVFEYCTVDNPICTPSRASILTGKPVPGHGVERVHDNLPPDEVLFTERLRQEAGYRTALFGKLHVSSRLKEEHERHPHDGFDIYEWCLEPSVAMQSPFNGYTAWLRETAPDFLAALQRNGRGELHHPESVHMSKWAADRTIAFIQSMKAGGQPFFCLMSLFDPHDPYEDYPLTFRGRIDEAKIPDPVPSSATQPECVEREQQGSYLGRLSDFSPEEIRKIRTGYAVSIAFLDEQVGRVLSALDDAGLTEDTLVIFLSDHGDQLGDHGLFVKGVALYEPTVGVPLLLRWPGRIAAGIRCTALAQGRDIAATCLAAAGLSTQSCPQSEDLVTMASQNTTRRSSAICAYRNSGVNDSGTFWDPPMQATMARDQRFKLTLYTSGGLSQRELFDLQTDPWETINRAGDPAYAATELMLLNDIASFVQDEAAAAPPRATSSIPDATQRLRNSIK
ncbi:MULTISPECIES: sulfatase-like hydrolase/transferase [unclassified Sinorhizobium]|uniref:sulfatase family protein n=1 Tax=unclassified Sinorhizobium TaxID=2613772 RepID=UPI0024C2CBE5|nr:MULTISPECIES: sulfatase-like hydrolase/transferase [unclassified Sinorhizobium]MDK1374527.1 sulfatase-like hydrolase/transferase [Sinorhizobium sp. 6-70]MDK1479143.1 sulfatase-like hydrolase/transferase [Sinorhizobium sp. 6-117]